MTRSEADNTTHTEHDVPLDKATPSETHAGSGRADPPKASTAWSNGNTWRRGSKATPVTQVAKESILAATEKASELVAAVQKPNPCAVTSSPRSASEDLSQRISSFKGPWATNASANRSSTLSQLSEDLHRSSTGCHGSNTTSEQEGLPSSVGDRQNEQLSANAKSRLDTTDKAKPLTPEAGQSNVSTEILPWYTRFLRYGEPSTIDPLLPPDGITQVMAGDLERPHTQRRNSAPGLETTKSKPEAPHRSWLGLWSAKCLDATDPVHAVTSATMASRNVPRSVDEAADRALDQKTELFVAQPKATTRTAWTFWSKEVPRDVQGETAITKEGITLDDPAGEPPSKRPKLDQVHNLQAKRPHSVESPRKPNDLTSQHLQPQPELPLKPDEFSIRNKSTKKASPAKEGIENLVLPSIQSTYRSAEKRSLLQSLSRWLPYSGSNNGNHVAFLDDPPQVKRAVAIGVHGYFPAPFIRSVLGQPTGTSIRFADGAAHAIQQWNDAHGHSCEIEKVVLEGEGKILERVGLLWELLLNWLDIIRRADFVMIACHSQGVPVALMLIAKLIEFGCVRDTRIGVCAMAGVNLGPFLDYKSRWIGGSAGELFDFARPESRVSKDYTTALETALKFGVKICYVGSIDDQLVSLDSSTFGPMDHPHIYRAVFVDGRVHAPDFLTNLVGFAFKLRNLGISDHGLIRELSQPLAGSLYGGEGHSKIYEENAVYYLAVQNALQTSALGERPLNRVRESAPATQNPYILPFSLRGVLEENFVRTELRKETTELLEQFDHWKPSSKVLKDVKFRLEGIRSKL
ncbi:MAG: hypothetical protein Q9222_002174 [Ikaeria aurantiellina]